MGKFADLGVTVSRSFKTRTVSISQGTPFNQLQGDRLEIAGSRTTVLRLTLPRASPITASFGKEGMGRKLIKLFKKELQTGDAGFDDAVYISTDTTEATAAWLADSAVRAAILELVEADATFEVAGTTVTAELQTHDDDDDPAVARLVGSLLALTSS